MHCCIKYVIMLYYQIYDLMSCTLSKICQAFPVYDIMVTVFLCRIALDIVFSYSSKHPGLVVAICLQTGGLQETYQGLLL